MEGAASDEEERLVSAPRPPWNRARTLTPSPPPLSLLPASEPSEGSRAVRRSGPSSGSAAAGAVGVVGDAAWRRMRTPSPDAAYMYSSPYNQAQPKSAAPAMQYVFTPVWGSCPVLWVQQQQTQAGSSSSAGRSAAAKSAGGPARPRAATSPGPADFEERAQEEGEEDNEGPSPEAPRTIRRSTRRGRRGRRGRPKKSAEGSDEEHRQSETEEEQDRLRQVCAAGEQAQQAGYPSKGGGAAGGRGKGEARGSVAAGSSRQPSEADVARASLEAWSRTRSASRQREATQEGGAFERQLSGEEGARESEDLGCPDPTAAALDIGTYPSRGSVGHPHTCALACKYARKSRGCKDGAACARCHLCKWSGGAGQPDVDRDRERDRDRGGRQRAAAATI
mmetsp:Transcript_30636/g.77440  ORF Transcript_30636/g.77440 Transcript_30636/m.77440 type:complete len:393 (+) Transcript_30636:76-1254(+)